jgi:cytoskeletal protein CcmA (bactofilin family)
MAMWRKQEQPKQEEPKAVTTAPEQQQREEVREQPRVAEQAAPIAATPVATPPPVRESAIPPAGHLTSTLVIKGEISGRDDLFIDGEVQGKIRLDEGKLTVGPNGRVSADVEAKEIVIRGKVKGNLNGRERVQISQTGCATGDIVTQRILIEDGAEMHGRVEIKRVEVRQAQSEPAQEKKKPEPVAAVAPAAAPVVAKVASTTPSAAPSTVTPAAVTPATVSSATANKSTAEPVVATARQSAPVA